MNIALIFAGGVGKRMNTRALPKQFLELHGKPIIIYTLENFEKHPMIDAICVVCVESHLDYMKQVCEKFGMQKVKWVIPGGSTSQESIYNGLCKIRENAPEDTVVLISDGVRPNLTPELIEKNIESVRKFGSGISCSKSTETPAQADDDGVIYSITDRSHAVIAKAPQSFWLGEIYAEQKQALESGRNDFIDCASLMKHCGHEIHMVECAWDNIKITTPSDYYIFRAILEEKENSQIFGL